MNARIAVAVGIVVTLGAFELPGLSAGSGFIPDWRINREPAAGGAVAQGRRGGGSGFATYSNLPSFGHGSEALAVNADGTVIAGHAWDAQDILHAVRWTLQGGSWTMTSLPRPADSTSAIARGVDTQGAVAGNDFPFATSRALLWSVAGAFTVLGCSGDPGTIWAVYAISGGGQVVAGQVVYVDENNTIVGSSGSVWTPGNCREELPPLVADGSSSAYASNGDGTLVGGTAGGVPVRWRQVGGQWSIEQLDTLRGTVLGANAAGDLSGHVYVRCGSASDCQRATIWYAGGGVRQLGTLGGEDSWSRDINSSGEVVGGSTSPHNGNTGYFWSESRGMLQLPFTGRWSAANALSDVRPDGTRLVVGMSSTGDALVWVVRNQ